MIPAKHGCSRFCKFSLICFVDTASIGLEILEAVTFCLVSAEYEFVVTSSFVASLVAVHAVFDVCKGDFRAIRAPGMRENGVTGYVILKILQP